MTIYFIHVIAALKLLRENVIKTFHTALFLISVYTTFTSLISGLKRFTFLVQCVVQSDTKRTETFEKANKNLRNPRKKHLLKEIEPLQLVF